MSAKEIGVVSQQQQQDKLHEIPPQDISPKTEPARGCCKIRGSLRGAKVLVPGGFPAVDPPSSTVRMESHNWTNESALSAK